MTSIHFRMQDDLKKIDIDIVHIKEIGAWGDIVNSSQLENIKEVQVMHPITFLNSNLV